MTSQIETAAPQTPAPEAETVERAQNRPVFRPLADIREGDNGLTLEIEMPGVGPDDVEVEIDKRALTVRGRRAGRAPEGWTRVHREVAEGDYLRAFTLSAAIDAERIEATMRDGVLTLGLARTQPAGPTRISVSAA